MQTQHTSMSRDFTQTIQITFVITTFRVSSKIVLRSFAKLSKVRLTVSAILWAYYTWVSRKLLLIGRKPLNNSLPG